MTLRAGVIGLGVGARHVDGYAGHPSCEMVAVCDIDAEKLEPYGHLRVTTEPEELLADPEIDVVSIASYDDAHFGQVRTALANGKHVFVEKPLVLLEREAVELAQLLADRPQLQLSTNLPLRRSPRFLRVRERIGAGELGEVFLMEGDYDYGRRHKLTDGWRGRIPYYSVFLGGGIHMVDLLLWMSGQVVTEVLGAQACDIATRGTRFRHPDLVTATMRTATGGLLKVNANLGCVSPHFHAVRVYGTEATFVNGLPDGVLHRHDGSEAVADPYPGVGKDVLIGPFLDSIIAGERPEVGREEAFEALSVCLAVERALETGQAVEVEYLLGSRG